MLRGTRGCGLSAVTEHAPPTQVCLFSSEGDAASGHGIGKADGGRRTDERLREIVIEPEKEGGWRMKEEFANANLGLEQVTYTSVEDGARYMEFMEAVTRSAHRGWAVGLPLQRMGGGGKEVVGL